MLTLKFDISLLSFLSFFFYLSFTTDFFYFYCSIDNSECKNGYIMMYQNGGTGREYDNR